MQKKYSIFIKKFVASLTILTSFVWMTGIGTLVPLNPVMADDPPEPQFWINTIAPTGGNISTTLSGQVYFSGNVNSSTVSYDSANASSSSVVLLEGRYDDYQYFDPWSPSALQLSSYDVETLQVAVNGTDSSRLDLDLSSGTLTAGTTYTLLVKDVCMTGHTTSEDNYWQYCPMRFETFTTAGGASYGVNLQEAPQASNFCSGTQEYFAGDVNQGIYAFNAFGDGTLNSIKIYATGTPATVIDNVMIYQDKTSSINSNGNWNLEPGIDTLLVQGSSWSDEGNGYYSMTLDIAPNFTLPTTDPNGNVGFITIDIASGASTGSVNPPVILDDSFTFAGTDGTALNTAMAAAANSFSCATPLVTVTSATEQSNPYTQDIAPTTSMSPMASSTALGIDFWNAAATLTAVTVQIIVPSGSGFDPQYGLNTLAANDIASGVNIYQDNKVSGTAGSFDAEQDTRLQLSAAPTWTTITGSSKQTTLTLSSPITLATDNTGSNAGSDFFIVIQTSDSPPSGSSFQVRLAANDFVTGFPTADFTTQTINIQSGGGMMADTVLISEIQVEGGAAGDEFIELYNPTSASVSLAAYSIQYKGGVAGSFEKKNFESTNSIPAYGFFLIAPTTYDGSPDEDLTNGTFALSSTGGTVFLVNDQTLLTTGNEATIVDKVAWGTGTLYAEGEAIAAPAANKSVERKSWYNATDTDMASGGMDENMGNHEDSDYNFMDFILKTTPVPQSTASTIENPMENQQGGAGSPVVINEVYYYPATGDTAWIELFNRTATAIDMTSYTLKVSDWVTATSTTANTFTFPSFTIPASTYATVWWNQTGTDTLTDLYTANGGGTIPAVSMSTLSGDIVLKDDGATIKDYVQYGATTQPNEAAATSTMQWVEDHVVPIVLKGQTMGRKGTMGDDTNRDDDWQTYASASEGTMNSGGDSFPPTAVTNVALADGDDVDYGLNGLDVTVTWTADSTVDSTFEKYLIYILPAATALNVTNHTPFTEIYSGQTTAEFTGMAGMTLDSQAPGVTLAAASYRAYVIAQDNAGNRSSAVSSVAASLSSTADNTAAGSDTQKPFIMHMSVWNAKAGAALVLLSRFDDDRTLGSVPGAGAQIVWQSAANSAAVDMVATATTTTNCVLLEANYHSCTIPSGNAVEGQVVSYYLKSADAAGNVSFMSASPDADMASYGTTGEYEYAVSQYPFIIDILAASDYTDGDALADLGGTIYQSTGSALGEAYVFVEGSASGPFQANSSGVFSITDNKMMPGSWPLVIFKDTYMDAYSNVFKGDSDLSFYMNSGTIQMSAGTDGGYMEMPFVTYTNPGDGMMGVPIESFSMNIGFSKTMNADTIVDNDIANAGSNIYLTTDGTDRVAGAISYNSGTNEATLTVTSGTSLTADTMYTLVVTTAVTDDMGSPISGGWRADGAYESTFNTMMDNTNLWGTGWEDYMEGGTSAGGMIGGGSTEYFGGMSFDQYGQGGNMMPPYVQGTTPNAGAFNVDRNSSVVIEFSEAMDSSSINTTNIKLYPIADTSAWSVGTAVTAPVTLDSSTQKIITVNPASDLDLNTAQDGWYVLKIMGAVKSAAGMWLGNPGDCGTSNPDTCLAAITFYESSFQLNSTAGGDTTEPTVLGTYPNNNDGITAGTTAVDVGIPSIDIGFSEPMTASTINAQNITLKAGSRSVTGKVKYDPMANSAQFVPSTAFSANTRYTLTVSTSTTDLASNYLEAASTVTFQTGGADETAPEIMYANGDDYSMALTYSEPMISAKQTDTSLWTYSVLNPANYYLNGFTTTGDPGAWGATITLTAPYNTASGTCLSALSGLNLTYDEPTNTVMIDGLGFQSGTTDFQIFIDTVRDKSNNAIADTGNRGQAHLTHRNAARSPLQNSTDTYGMLGPGGGGMMMMGPMGGGGPMGPATGGGSMAPSMDMGMMGMMKGGAFPMNAMSGQTSNYFIDVPITSQILSGGKIVLTFPSGFNVASAQQDLYSPVNMDFNEWNTGTVTFACSDANKNCGGGATITTDENADSTKGGTHDDGITVNTSSRIINIHLHGDTTANDFLHIDLKGIVNSSIPKEFGTDGYTVDIKTMSPDGALLENITTMPFFINQGGSDSLTVVVNCGNADQDSGTMNVFLGSPMTGPMEDETTAFVNGIATSSFTSLISGQYHIFTDPFISVGSNDYLGKPMPEMVNVSGATSKNITVAAEDAGTVAAITVTLTGDFSTNSVADSVDIFANSPTGFRVKTVTPNTDDLTDADGEGTAENQITEYILYLPSGNWMIGVGPAMPKGPMAGPPTMPDWMPPMPVDITSDGSTPGAVSISIAGQSSKTLAGIVTDGVPAGSYTLGTPIASAEVFAYQPNGGFGGAHTNTAADGTFTLKIPVLGMYKVGTYKPGLPQAKDKTVDVRDAGNYDSQGTILTATDGANPFVLKVKKPAYTISGKVLNRDSQAVAYAPVWAWQSSGYGHADTMTDASGNYILYVDDGTWYIETDAPGVGWLQYNLPLTIDGASQSNINLRPDTDLSWYDIAGTISINDTAQTYMPIRAVEFDVNGNYLGREYGGSTDSDGNYTITVQGTGSAETYKYYRVDIWTPDYGEVGLTYDEVSDSRANIKISNAATSTADITITAANLNTATMVFANKADYAAKEAFVNIDGVSFSGAVPSPTNYHKSVRVADISGSNPTVSLEAGDYFVFVDIPGYGGYMPTSDSAAFDDTKGCITIDGTSDTINFALPDLDSASAAITISGTISGPGALQKDAWVWIGNPSTGFHTGTNAASSTGAYSLTVPILSSGNYFVGADMPGYMSEEPTSNVGTADATIDFTLTAFSYSIAGKLYGDVDGGTTNVYDTGEALPNGWVHAEEITTGAEAHGPVDATGSYNIGVNDGEWKIYGISDGYTEAQYSISGVPSTVTVDGVGLTDINILLTADANWSMKSKSKPMAPSSGGVIDDTAQNTSTGKADGTGVKLTVPPNALGSSSSNGNVSATETSAVAATDSMKPFGNKGKNITATDNSGQAITNLNDYVDMEMVLYKADIDAETDITDFDKLKTMKMGYWDDTVNEWVNLPTTKTAYHKMDVDTDWTLYNGTTTPAVVTGFEKFIDDALGSSATLTAGTDYEDYKLVFTASTNHFSVFALGTSPDGLAPSAPTSVAQSSGNGSSVVLTWTAPTTNSDATTLTDLYGYAVYRSTDGSSYSQISTSAILSGAETYTDSTVSSFTSYYYKVTAGDDDDTESAYSTALQVCSNKTIDNGTVAGCCTITCNSGYAESGNSCVAESSGGSVISSGPSATTATETTIETKLGTLETTTTSEAEEEITTTDTAEAPVEQTLTQKIVSRAQKITQIISEAKTAVLSKISSLLSTLGITRNIAQEKSISSDLVAPLLVKADVITKEVQYATTNFITYGTETTKVLGEGERAGVLNSFHKAYDRLPQNDTDWQDAIKIANGRFPAQQSIEKEQEALKTFIKIYKRLPDFSNGHDEAALKIVTYGIRPTTRNLDSEKAAIKSFESVYGEKPATTTDWDIMRAIAYSGASR